MSTDRIIAHYRLQKCLGSGGAGAIYKAEDLKLGRTVALKLVSAKFDGNHPATRILLNEARAAAALNSPHITTIHEIGEQDNLPFIVMEYVEGETLAQRIEKGPIQIETALDIAIALVQGIRDAHARGVIHRDLKSSNIMITPAGAVKILDFGLAFFDRCLAGSSSADAVGTISGTAGYMSPEQIRGENVDPRTDIFSFGVVLYEMVASCRRFDGRSPADSFQATLGAAPKPLRLFRDDVPLELESIVRKCLGKRREERYASAGDLLADLVSLKSAFASDGVHPAVQPTGDHLQAKQLRPRLWHRITSGFRKGAQASGSLPQGAAFRGLLSFQEADRDRFYGREMDTIALFERVSHEEDNLAAILAYEIQPLFWSRREDALPMLNGAG